MGKTEMAFIAVLLFILGLSTVLLGSRQDDLYYLLFGAIFVIDGLIIIPAFYSIEVQLEKIYNVLSPRKEG